jgi:hypothetical protein
MFRKHNHTNALDLKRIEQQVAAIKFLSEALMMSSQQYQLSSYLSVMMNAINTFEKHRVSDYLFNEKKRAEQVLHTRNIFNTLYKNHLKQSESAIMAHALKHELKDYSNSVEDFISEVELDLTNSMIDKYEIAENEMEWALLNSELRQSETEYHAYRLAKLAEETEEDDMDYLIYNVNDDEISEEELSEKPYLRGTMPSDSDEEYQPETESYASYSDNDYQSESASDFSFSDEESQSRSYSSTSPLLSQYRYRNEWLRNSWSDAVTDSDDDCDYDYSPRCR